VCDIFTHQMAIYSEKEVDRRRLRDAATQRLIAVGLNYTRMSYDATRQSKILT
jgi:hypothetical protein